MTRVSFKDSALYATRGLFQAVSNERNVKIQLVIGAAIIFFSVLLDISKIYLITLIILIFLVIILEMFNRGFEKLIDLISPEYNKEFGKVKDAMAGVVLATFLLAIIVSGLILYQPLMNLLIIISQSYNLLLLMTMNILAISIIILVFYIKNNNHSKK